MATLTSLPCEVIAMILRNLGRVSDLVGPILTCRHVYASFYAHPDIAVKLLLESIPQPLLHYSIAATEAARFATSPSDDVVTEFLDVLFDCPDQLTAKVRHLALASALRMERTQHVIDAFARDCAIDHWRRLAEGDADMVDEFELSETEYFRFARAFYRIEIHANLFRCRAPSSPARGLSREDRLYLSRHSPWENEQLASIHEFLEKKFLKASREVIAHDVQFGKVSADYLRVCGNPFVEWGVAQGLEFVFNVMNETSYSNKLAMLQTHFEGKSAQICGPLVAYGQGDEYAFDDSLWLSDLTVDGIKSLARRPDYEDVDDGPPIAWRHGHRYWALGRWSMLSDCAGLRERGYTLWDLDRMERWKLLKLYEQVPEDVTYGWTQEEERLMRESFTERSDIWDRNGRGYWSKGDYGSIEWL